MIRLLNCCGKLALNPSIDDDSMYYCRGCLIETKAYEAEDPFWLSERVSDCCGSKVREFHEDIDDVDKFDEFDNICSGCNLLCFPVTEEDYEAKNEFHNPNQLDLFEDNEDGYFGENFNADDRNDNLGCTGHGDISYSDADPGL